MNNTLYNYISILVAFIVSYLIRVLPLTLIRKPIKSKFIQSFLYYVPYACLAAMVFPAILDATANRASAIAGFAAAFVTAYREKSLLTVALGACGVVFLVERLMVFL